MKIKSIKNPIRNAGEKYIQRGSDYHDSMRYSRVSLKSYFNINTYYGLGIKICLKRK